MQTSLRGISNRAAKDKGHRFGNLYGLLDENFLKWCFWQLKRDAAPGVDRVDFYEYRENLDENIAESRQTSETEEISSQAGQEDSTFPKSMDKLRPLGILATDDKVLQRLQRPRYWKPSMRRIFLM